MSTNDNGAYITISRLKQNVKENGGEHARINRQRSSQEDHEKGIGRARKRRRNTTEQCREVYIARARERRRNTTEQCREVDLARARDRRQNKQKNGFVDLLKILVQFSFHHFCWKFLPNCDKRLFFVENFVAFSKKISQVASVR